MKISLISIIPGIHDYGMRTISACLKQAGHDVDLIFLLKEFYKKYSETSMNNLVKLTKGSDLAGFSVMSNFWDHAIQVTQKLKDNYDFPILWGGIHPTVRPEECLDYADMVCIGEGEETVVELADKIQNKQYYYDVKGMAFNDKGKIIVNGTRERPGSKKAAIIKSLDQIPFQDYDYRNHFILKGENIIKMDLKILEQCDYIYQTLPTRGCPFGCTYCVNNTILAKHPHQKSVRIRSVDNIIMELQEIKKNLPFIKMIQFSDDAVGLMSVDELSKFSKRYKEQIGLPLIIIGIVPAILTREKLSLLMDAGLIELGFGIQSASEITKKLYKRPHANHRVADAIKMVNEYRDQLKVNYDIILDNPWDTDEDLIETLMFLSKLPTPFILNLCSLIFFPGTELYRKAKKEGLIKDDVKDIYGKHIFGCTNTYLNKLFRLLNDYALVGIGISPIIMFILTHKITRKLYLHKFLRNVIRALLPFFRYIGRSTRPSTRLYEAGNIIKFRCEGKETYLSDMRNDFNMGISLDEFHSEDMTYQFGGDEHVYSTQKRGVYYDGKRKKKTPLD
jgi:radical SAM superfamily enzyme YgiQ (UPF0313 family)